jgi:hypothetical protein
MEPIGDESEVQSPFFAGSGPVVERHAPPRPELRPGWSVPRPGELPRPTYWPAVMALGIAFLFWGIISSAIISGVGLVLFAIALGGWIGELRHGA